MSGIGRGIGGGTAMSKNPSVPVNNPGISQQNLNNMYDKENDEMSN